MKLVIEIPEKAYNALTHTEFDANLVVDEMRKAIANGTPLPKGHGRIIDYGYVVDAIDDWINAGEYGYTNATDYLRNRVEAVPTIIEGSEAND